MRQFPRNADNPVSAPLCPTASNLRLERFVNSRADGVDTLQYFMADMKRDRYHGDRPQQALVVSILLALFALGLWLTAMARDWSDITRVVPQCPTASNLRLERFVNSRADGVDHLHCDYLVRSVRS